MGCRIAADFRRLRQPEVVIDARRNLLRVKTEWHPRFFSCIGLWLQLPGSLLIFLRIPVLLLTLWSGIGGPDSKPVVLTDHDWITLYSGPLTDVDISLWPFSFPMLVKFSSFLSTLRWPEGLNEMGKFGVSYLEVLILFEKWMGHRFLPEKTVPLRHRPGRPIFIGTSPVSEGVSRFIPGSQGPHLSMSRHLGWLQCGHGLSCRPLESSMPGCLKPLLGLPGYPATAINALSNGLLRIRHCTYPFARRFFPWALGSGEGLGQLSHIFPGIW